VLTLDSTIISQGNSALENGEIQSEDPSIPALNKLKNREVTQFAIDALYRFAKDKLYVGAKYNKVSGDLVFGSTTTQPAISQGIRKDISVDRVAIAAGWFITKNILLKAEYVQQQYNDFPDANILNKGKFNGWLLEGVIGF
jgi:hypothetical protein